MLHMIFQFGRGLVLIHRISIALEDILVEFKYLNNYKVGMENFFIILSNIKNLYLSTPTANDKISLAYPRISEC